MMWWKSSTSGTRPSADGIFNLSMLPPKAERMVKAAKA